MAGNHTTFSIGQIVYILSNKNQEIIPALVIEEATIQTLEGTKTSWKFLVGSASKNEKFTSDQVGGNLFTSLEEIEAHLIEKLKKFVNETITKARSREETWYSDHLKKAKQPVFDNNKIDPESLLAGIESTINIGKDPAKELARNKIRELVKDDDDSDPNTETFIENDVKVRIHNPF